ncbi:MAG: hydantoinase B/oxoprolinase family protein, partial [Tissierellia bacterium]|nr:hydantoinase B/oxoprolinase family protein [Tissierellia bacterium]
MEEKATFSNYKLQKGDLIRFISGGGGGYGNPYERDVDLVLEDVLDGYITVDEARDCYGVVIEKSEKSFKINNIETKKLRQKYK